MKIYCDYDSTLNSMAFSWVQWINLNHNKSITTKDISHWYWVEETFNKSFNDFWKNPTIYSLDIVKPFNEAVLFIKKLQKTYGEDNVSIVTHSYPGTEQAKDRQIIKWFDNINVIHKENKSEITKDGILIDDRPCSVAKHCKLNNQIGIVFTNNDQYGWATVEPILEDLEQIKNKIYFKKL